MFVCGNEYTRKGEICQIGPVAAEHLLPGAAVADRCDPGLPGLHEGALSVAKEEDETEEGISQAGNVDRQVL